ncbi:MAG: site-specific integrase [Tannerellaceae bacterium]|jgi:integrase|nr:site-specific integrase [Tannerellaceae bacterium]
MATFTICTRNKGRDGLYSVYIRVAHKNDRQYINTGLLVSAKGLKEYYDKDGKRSIEVSDKHVVKTCLDRIDVYKEKINRTNANGMDCKTLVAYLSEQDNDLSLTDYAKKHISGMKNEDRDSSANTYGLALSSLQKFLGKENILFKELTGKKMEEWIDSMKDSARKKSLYPTCVRAVIKEAMKEYNDYDLNVIRIPINPFARTKIPKGKIPEKRSVKKEIIRRVLTSEIKFPLYDGISRKELARDVSTMIFCLAGMNAADLYDMKDSSLGEDWKLRYNRKKTRDKSDRGAYMEIAVPEFIRPLFDKYKGKNGRLLLFSNRFVDSVGFVKTVDNGLKSICEELGITKITTYTLRHSWATIAQNECGASTELVAFSLNHESAHKITEGYIRKDYTPVDRLNEKVIEMVLSD